MEKNVLQGIWRQVEIGNAACAAKLVALGVEVDIDVVVYLLLPKGGRFGCAMEAPEVVRTRWSR